MSPTLIEMKHFALILLAALTWSVNAQITYPFNPDGNGDQYIATVDLQDFLVHYGQEFEPGELLVDSIPLSAYLEAMEALILANAMPAGTNPGQFLRWNGVAWELVMPKVGCTLPEACNYDETAHVLLESMCVLPDACGVCGGPGAAYDCGCVDIPEGDCDCDGNVVDALGVCGGTCEADEDGDGICDDGDSCVGLADECGVCNGPGAIYDCGCTEPVEGTCDCDGNVEDVLGVCGGSCTADEDFDGICDEEDDCVGAYDGCGVCNGPGPVLGCGCNDIPEGFCDCNGNVLDAVGTCGGACENDLNGDGICDDGSIPGCIYAQACNYDPSASIYDGSCDFTSCYGCTDPTACNYSSAFTVENGSCFYPGCTDEAACNFDGAAGCEDGTCTYPGCTDSAACNFDGAAGCDAGSCVYPGCTDPSACNWGEMAGCDDGSCSFPGCTTEGFCNYDASAGCDDGSCENESCFGCMDTTACNFSEFATADDGSCDYSCYGCIDAAACNYDEILTLDDGSCVYPGCNDVEAVNFDEAAGCEDGSCVYAGCTVDLACNYNPVATIEDGSCEFGTCPGCNDPDAINYNPTSTNDEICLLFCEPGGPIPVSLQTSLAGGQSFSETFVLNETSYFVGCNVSLTFSGSGASWPADAGIQIVGSGGDCVFWGGYNFGFGDDNCTDLGSGDGASWPGSWQVSSPGTYTATIEFEDAIEVVNAFEIIVTNAWDGSETANYSFDFAFETCSAN